jgi:hypothetical protein
MNRRVRIFRWIGDLGLGYINSRKQTGTGGAACSVQTPRGTRAGENAFWLRGKGWMILVAMHNGATFHIDRTIELMQGYKMGERDIKWDKNTI